MKMSHYYTDNKDLSSNKKEFTYHFDNETFYFVTDNGVFSKNNVDYGSYLLIKNVYKLDLGKKILDLGCGYGPIGIILKRFNPLVEMNMVDVNSRALELAHLNCQKNKIDAKIYLSKNILELNNCYDSIILNPPIRAGKVVIYDLYEKSYQILNNGGSLYIVIQKKHGANSSISKLETLFDEVKVLDKDGGHLIIKAQK